VPAWATVQWPSAAIAIAAMLAMLRFKVGMGWVLLASGVAGVGIGLLSR
jgi:chromate transporter